MNKTIKEHFIKYFPNTGIETGYGGSFWIRFELGGKLKNGSLRRVNQVVERALKIFDMTIGDDSIVMLIEEYPNEFLDPNNEYKNYLYTLISPDALKQFTKYPGPFEQTYIDTDENGNKEELIFEDKIECDLLIGQLNTSDLKIEKIIRGMANLEMGLEPCIPQRIYFLNPTTRNSFNMYDDRGCDVWSHSKENLYNVYTTLNPWILDYNREQIDLLFK